MLKPAHVKILQFGTIGSALVRSVDESCYEGWT
jgi:hypothetical protein